MSRAALAGAALAAVTACQARAPLASCNDDLRGVYAAEPIGAPATAERWMILDDGAALAAYPLFPDPAALAGAATEIGPRRITLARAPGAATLDGDVHRRYLQRAAACEGRAPAHVTRCTGDTLELVLGDPVPPIGFAPCAWASAAPSRAMRWRRE